VKKAASFYIASSGGFLPACKPSPDPIPYCTEEWNPKDTPEISVWPASPQDVGKVKKRMVDINHLASSAGDRYEVFLLNSPNFRYTGLMKKYGAVSSSGLNLWAQYPKSLCEANKTLKDTVFSKECTPAAIFESCSLKFLTKEVEK
jgi:hypothetical protein